MEKEMIPEMSAGEVRAMYEASPEYRLGCQILDSLTQNYGISSADAAAMLGSQEGLGIELLSKRAAAELGAMEAEGRLSGSLEEYIKDPEFIGLLKELPPKAALRVYESEAKAKKSEEVKEEEKELARQEILEKLKARALMPKQARAGVSASAKPDFGAMSREEFENFKKRYFGK